MSSKRKGWVYVVSNPSIQGQVKIGYTDTAVEVRMEQLFSTELPTPIKKEYEALVINAKKVEGKTHRILSEFRINQSREFFNCETIQAVEAVREAASSLQIEILHEEIFFEVSKTDERVEKIYNESGTLEQEAFYEGDELISVKVYHQNGNLKKEKLFEDGVPHRDMFSPILAETPPPPIALFFAEWFINISGCEKKF